MDKDTLNLKKLVCLSKAKITYIIIPISLSLFAALLDGAAKYLLIPMIKGLISADYSFIIKNHTLKTLLPIIPLSKSNSNLSIFLIFLVVIFIISVGQHIFTYFSYLSTAYWVRTLSSNMRKTIFSRYLSLGKAFFDKENFGHLDNILIDFVNFITIRLLQLQPLLLEICRLITYVALLFFISWKLTIFIIFIFPISYYLLRWLVKKIRRTSGDLSFSRNRLNQDIFNIITNIALVKSYAKEDAELKKFCEISEENKKLEFSIDKKLSLVTPLQNIFMVIAITVLLLVIAYMVNEKIGDISAFLVYLYVLRGTATSFNTLNIFKSVTADISGPMENILEVFDDKDKEFINEGNQTFEALKKDIEFNHLNFSYINNKQVLKDVSFVVKKGEITALVGPTGSGKTTLINLLLRFYNCPSQSILIDNQDISDFTLKSLMSHMSLVSQNTMLFNDTIKNNIIYGIDYISDQQLTDVLKRARLYEFIIKLPHGLNTLVGDEGVRLSGGEKQRISIARALLKNVEILILDEATSSLDTNTERLIQSAIEEMIKGRTVIIIAHRLSTIKRADKIIVIENGEILEQGSLNELLNKKEKFYQYWEDQKFY